MGEIEIIPPRRPLSPTATPAAPVPVSPQINTGGIVTSTLVRWHAQSQERALTAISAASRAQADLYVAHTQALESYAKRQAAAARVEELPEIIATERAVRRAERAEELRQMQHNYDVAQMRRQTELARTEAVLEDARQALRAQRELGYCAYEIEWKRRQCEMLDIELSSEERREILREHRTGQAPGNGAASSADDDAITAALCDARTQMRASGLDTTRIDVLLRQRGKGR
jgi:multidrug efflux pump subunit AcrA (membrane-fusion protein)